MHAFEQLFALPGHLLNCSLQAWPPCSDVPCTCLCVRLLQLPAHYVMRVPTINALACSQLDCALTDTQLTELFGRGSKEGLLHWVKDGTVLLNNVDKVRA